MSKKATVDYLRRHFKEDVSLQKIYRYLDKLYNTKQELVQAISVEHTRELFGGNLVLLIYDVTTLYFETTEIDELRESGFSKDGRNSNPQVVLGLWGSRGGYPLSYSLFNGSQYEGYTMIPIVDDFVQRFNDERAKKNAHNRDEGVMRLRKRYTKGTLTKADINKRGYNKFLSVSLGVTVSIDDEKIKQDAIWDGLKGYKTNTDMSPEEIYEAYQYLWNVERLFRITKGTLDVRPMFHFTPRRIEAHVCICFVVLKVYKELERLLKRSGCPYSVKEVLKIAETVVTIEIARPENNDTVTKTLCLTEKERAIAYLIETDDWLTL